MSKLNCPHCGAINPPNILYCAACTKLLPPQYPNYFVAMGLPIQYGLEPQALDAALYRVIKLFHPDQYTNKSPLEKNIAEQHSGYFTQAYRVLKDNLSRLEYVLKIQYNLKEEELLAQPSAAFLLEVMDWREEMKGKGWQEKQQKVLDLARIQKEYYNECAQYSLTQDKEKMLAAYITLKFVERFKQELQQQLDQDEETL